MQQPPVDAEVLAQQLHVRDQVRGRVVPHVGGRVAGVRPAPPAAALVEQDEPVALGVERPPLAGRGSLIPGRRAR